MKNFSADIGIFEFFSIRWLWQLLLHIHLLWICWSFILFDSFGKTLSDSWFVLMKSKNLGKMLMKDFVIESLIPRTRFDFWRFMKSSSILFSASESLDITHSFLRNSSTKIWVKNFETRVIRWQRWKQKLSNSPKTYVNRRGIPASSLFVAIPRKSHWK